MRQVGTWAREADHVEPALCGAPVALGVVEYTYRFGDEPEQTVPAGPDGTATISWTPADLGEFGGWCNLLVRSRSANGLVSDARYYSVGVDGREPDVIVSGEGTGRCADDHHVPGQLPGSAEFSYRFNEGPEQIVAAGADGTAEVVFTPTEPYANFIEVRSRTAGGLASYHTLRGFWVNP